MVQIHNLQLKHTKLLNICINLQLFIYANFTIKWLNIVCLCTYTFNNECQMRLKLHISIEHTRRNKKRNFWCGTHCNNNNNNDDNQIHKVIIWNRFTPKTKLESQLRVVPKHNTGHPETKIVSHSEKKGKLLVIGHAFNRNIKHFLLLALNYNQKVINIQWTLSLCVCRCLSVLRPWEFCIGQSSEYTCRYSSS